MTTKIGAATLSLAALMTPAHAQQKAPADVVAAAAICFGKQHGTWQQIIDNCSKVIAVKNLDPNDKSGAHYNRGAAQLRIAQPDKALNDFTEALKLKPDFVRALQSRAGIYVGQQKFDKAIADLNKAITIDPKSSTSYNNRGMAHLGNKDFKAAIADLTKAVELAPADADSYSARGTAYMTNNETDKALADFSRAVELDPKQTVALFNRGMLLMKTGEKAKAKADFEAVLALEPGHKLAGQQLAALKKAGG